MPIVTTFQKAARRRISAPPRPSVEPPAALQAEYNKLIVRKADLSLAAGALRITENPARAISQLHEDLRHIFNPSGGDWEKSLREEVIRIDDELESLSARIYAAVHDAQLDGAA